MSLKIVGVVDEEPFDTQTWSGSSAYFFDALRQRDVLQAAVSASPSKPVKRIYQLLSFHPQINRWRFKYHLNLGFYRQMTRAAKRRIADIDVDAYQAILQIGAWYDMTGFKNKSVVSYHDGALAALLQSPYGYPPLSRRYIERTLAYERDLYQRIDLIFPMSKWLAGYFVKDSGVSAKKVFPVGAGINLPYARKVESKSYEAPRILFVGKDFNRKGGNDLLEAFRQVRTEIKEAELTIIGPRLASPPPGVRCIGFLSKANQEELVRLLDEYQRATLFVMPSLYEPFGIVFAEAMAHKLPCIGSNICAMPEIIDHGQTGYLVPPREPTALAQRILTLLKNPEECREFGERGYRKYQRQFTWQAVTDRICEVISKELQLR
jgi:glycosyltransferase involved in cell wall biosynthesis